MNLSARAQNDSARLTVIIFGVMLISFIWVGIFMTIQTERQQAIKNAVKDTGRYARAFAEHTVRTLYGLDEIALFLKYEAERSGPKMDIPKLLQGNRFAGQPFVQLSSTDETGTIVASHIVPFAQANISDLDHFKMHQQTDTGRVYIGQALQGRISGKWTMHMSRRINKPDGSFGGVVVVGVDPNYFAEFYRQVELGQDASISLIGRDGIVRVRQDGSKVSFGSDLRQSVVMEKLKTAINGSFITESRIDGISRIYNYRTLPDFPLVVIVGVGEKEELAELNQRVSKYYAAGTGISVLIIVFLGLILAGLARQSETEKVLRQNEERFRAYFNDSRSVMLLIDRMDGRIVDANPAAAEYYGYTLDRMKSMNINEINTLESAQIRVLMENAAARRENSFHFTHRLANGEMRQVDVYATPIYIENQEFLLSIVHDVTDRVRLESELKNREQALQNIITGTQAGTWEWYVQTGETVFNERWAEIVGYTLAELQPTSIETWMKLAHPDDLAESGRLLNEHFEGKTPYYRCDSRMKHKNGSWVWVYDTGMVIEWDAAGKPLLMAGTHHDITQRKWMEEELRASQERYQALMRQSFEGLVVVNSKTREVVETNHRFTEILGYSLPEDAPLYTAHFMLDAQPDADRIFDTLNNQGYLSPEIRVFRHKNGTRVSVERTATVINISGQDYNLVSLRDLTKERRRQEELVKEIELAKRVQQELLPKPSASPHIDIRSLYYPSSVVGGDSYYFERLNDGSTLRGFLVDVSGHGIATALQTASVNMLIRDAAEAELTLMEHLCQVNRRALNCFVEGSYATMLAFEVDLLRRELRYIGAGITKFYLNGKAIETPGMFVGIFEDAVFDEGAVPIAAGDCIHFLTDGFTDALAQAKHATFWSRDGKDFDADVRQLEQLGESGNLHDDATGICIRIDKTGDV